MSAEPPTGSPPCSSEQNFQVASCDLAVFLTHWRSGGVDAATLTAALELSRKQLRRVAVHMADALAVRHVTRKPQFDIVETPEEDLVRALPILVG